MKTKLTLEVLSAYLPYDTQLIFNGETNTMKSCFNNIDKSDVYITDNYHGQYSLKVRNFKPILYPLARLTEEAFSEKLYIEEIVNDTEQHCDAYDEWMDSYIDNPLPERILQAPYEVVLELLKQHYNVFDLAPNLYIDKSTISQ